MHSRRLTVSRQYPESRAASYHRVPIAPMPILRLRRRWLDEAGFTIGANVRVEVATGRLVLEVVESAAPREER